jgi:hypothetical protein
MLKLESIKVDLAAERDGQFIAIPEWEGVKLGVRSLEIPAYKIALDQLVQRYARRYKGKPVPPDIRDADVGDLLATHILFGWEGITPEYSANYAKEFLSGSSGRELAKQVLWAAGQVAAVDAEFTEEAVKN